MAFQGSCSGDGVREWKAARTGQSQNHERLCRAPRFDWVYMIVAQEKIDGLTYRTRLNAARPDYLLVRLRLGA